VAEASEAVRAWSVRRDGLWVAAQASALLLPAWLLSSGVGARLTRRVERLTGGRRLLTAALCAGGYAVLFVLASLPVAVARQAMAEPFGLGAPDWGSWAEGRASRAWPLVLGGVLLGWAPYLLFARSPRLWPIWSGLLLTTLLAAALLAQPSQHDLRPVVDPGLKATIATLAHKAGAADARVAIREAERAGRCGGASTLGLGPTKVLAIDTALLRHHPDGEVAQVIAHELGHYARKDDWKALFVGVAVIVGGLAALSLGAGWAIRRSGGRFGFHRLANPASLPLLVLIALLFALAASAAFHTYGRHLEQEADRFSLELTREGEAQASLMQRYLRCSPWADPDTSWIQRTFRQNHPSFRSRIAVAAEYRSEPRRP
jgi:Zn-dependent protease with chaperone function